VAIMVMLSFCLGWSEIAKNIVRKDMLAKNRVVEKRNERYVGML